MKNKNLLLIIDMQNDFCLPTGALYVPGAESDATKLAQFIVRNETAIDSIVLTQDSHHIMDISHPSFWQNKRGENPEPFTAIDVESINSGKWTPRFSPKFVKMYIKSLYEQKEFPHTIWPEHCITGSSGAAFVDDVMTSVSQWARKGKFFDVIQKGLNPLTEHFGALRANVPIPEDKTTQLNQQLLGTLQKYENIIIAGEAKSHCVANTVKQITELENFNSKLILLEDCMSNVPGFDKIADPIYELAMNKGAVFTTSKKLTL